MRKIFIYISWVLLSLLILLVFIFTFMKTPEELIKMLSTISYQTRYLAVIIHGVYLMMLVIGFLFKKIRNIIFSLLMLIISGTAFIVSIIYLIPPNIIIFGMFFILLLVALIKKQLNFDLKNLKCINFIISFIGIIFGFWYLHWVKEPLFFNALIYSPLGIVNCPSMVAICGLLCLTTGNKSVFLEWSVGIITLYFGFFGVLRFNVYVDIALIIVALYIIIRSASNLDYNNTFLKNSNDF